MKSILAATGSGALAVTSPNYMALLPDVPTMEEAGVKDVEAHFWQAVVGPKGFRAEVRAKRQIAIATAFSDEHVRQQFTCQGFEIVANTPAPFADFQAQELARWRRVIEAAKIAAN